MGKKERNIKKLNNEFYKEYNNENLELEMKKEEKIFDDKRQEEADEEKAFEDRERLARHIVSELTEYADYQGLELSVSEDNMFNYIGFFLGERARKEVKGIETVRVAEKKDVFVKHVVVETTENDSEVRSADVIVERVEDPEIVAMRNEIIRKSGEDTLTQSYLNENYGGEMPQGWKWKELTDHLRSKFIKLGGKYNYEKVVDGIGKYNYDRASKRIGL